MLNVLDLFSGTGELGRAFKEALEFHGIPSRTAAYCERERYPQGILLSRMFRGELDVAPISTDVTELKAEGLPPIDAIIAGFPCQDISTAGLGAGLVDGKRSSLFFEIIRLASELKPVAIGLENVPALTIRGGVRVIAELANLGYDARWGVMAASDFGATHRRERWWCVAYAPSRGWESAGDSLHGDGRGASSQPLQHGEALANTEGGGAGGNDRTWGLGRIRQDRPPYPNDTEAWRKILEIDPTLKPSICGVANGFPNRNDRIRACGNGVDFVCAKEAFKKLLGGESC